jgi:cytochrome c oxidase cbb3-type subunit III
MKQRTLFPFLLIGLLLAGCGKATKSQSSPSPPEAVQAEPKVALVQLAPGGSPPTLPKSEEAKKYDGNADQIAAGHQLFQAFNCSGCHFNGGGGIGPALMDNKWIYGSSMENIASTIREGRPNGMPSFRAMLTDEQVWQLAAYVRSLSAEANKKAASR